MSWDHDSITSKRTVKKLTELVSGKQLDHSAKTSIKKPLILDVILGKKKYTRAAGVLAQADQILGENRLCISYEETFLLLLLLASVAIQTAFQGIFSKSVNLYLL